MATLKVRELGDYIREQRQASSISLRQLARLANVSNPYLSQIERGLRKPSAEILQQIAKALRISAEALYVQAGILDERETDTDVPAAILRDEWVTERQKQVLLEIYDSFRKENDGQRQVPPVDEPEPAPAKATKPAKPRKAAAKKAATAKTATAKTVPTESDTATAKTATAAPAEPPPAAAAADATGIGTGNTPAATAAGPADDRTEASG